MTDQEFRARYHLLEQVADRPVRTFHAVASTGAVVMAHFIDPDAAPERTSKLTLLPEAARAKVIDVADVDGNTVVVTKFILDFTSFDQWLDAVGGAGGRGATPAMPGPGAGAEPTRSQPEEPPTAVPQFAPEAPMPHQPGEFTLMFSAPAVSATGAQPAVTPPRPAAPPPARSGG